jgi:hypothetical protein
MPVQLTFIVSSDDLEKLANAHRGLLGAALACQASEADMRLRPRGPKRRSFKTYTKLFASQQAKQIYPAVQWLIKYPEFQKEWFRDLCVAVKRSRHATPSAQYITAWLVEQLYHREFDFENLRRPTQNIDKFAREYLYTQPKMIEYMPYELREIVKKALAAQKNSPVPPKCPP